MYYFSEQIKKGMNAGSKARNDAEAILSKRCTAIHPYTIGKNKLAQLFILLKSILKTDKNELIVIQYPLPRGYSKLLPFISSLRNTVVLVHDLTDLRDGITDGKEVRRFKKCKFVISHNSKMTDYFRNNGLTTSIIDLNIFDYLYEGMNSKSKEALLCYAGSLDKADFINNLPLRRNNINVYGVGFDESKSNDKVEYKGSYDSEQIVSELSGRFGLVWDGTSLDYCDGVRGEYLKYNNPHKLSMYVAAGIPVIIWNKSAMTDFVIDNGIGIAVDSLNDIEDILQKIDSDQYDNMKNNVKVINERITKGYYLNNTLDYILGIYNGKE